MIGDSSSRRLRPTGDRDGRAEATFVPGGLLHLQRYTYGPFRHRETG